MYRMIGIAVHLLVLTISPYEALSQSLSFSDSSLSKRNLSISLRRPTVVPNPWMADEPFHMSLLGNATTMMFDNLPEVCTLKIYTETGDHVRTIQHEAPGRFQGSSFWDMRNRGNKLVESGIYILVVTNARNIGPFFFHGWPQPDDDYVISLPEDFSGDLPDQFVKFVIIR